MKNARVKCVKLTPAVDFINNLCDRFSFESAFLYLRFGKKGLCTKKRR
jgi:hypothetical protein